MADVRATRVVVGVGESLAALQALRYAVGEARRRGSVLHAVRVWRFTMPWQGYDMDQWRDEFAAEAEVVLRRAFESAMGGVPIDVSVELVAVEGAPARELIAYADRDDDVLVVGAPMRRWRTSMSLAGQCLRRAACPVVAVPAPALARTRRPRALARDVQREVVRHIQAGVDGGGH